MSPPTPTIRRAFDSKPISLGSMHEIEVALLFQTGPYRASSRGVSKRDEVIVPRRARALMCDQGISGNQSNEPLARRCEQPAGLGGCYTTNIQRRNARVKAIAFYIEDLQKPATGGGYGDPAAIAFKRNAPDIPVQIAVMGGRRG